VTGLTEPGLVALYDIRPRNGAGLFLQPRSPHGASVGASDNPGTWCVSDSEAGNSGPISFGLHIITTTTSTINDAAAATFGFCLQTF